MYSLLIALLLRLGVEVNHILSTEKGYPTADFVREQHLARND